LSGKLDLLIVTTGACFPLEHGTFPDEVGLKVPYVNPFAFQPLCVSTPLFWDQGTPIYFSAVTRPPIGWRRRLADRV